MGEADLAEHRLTRAIIAAFYEVYNGLGPGFLESIYATALEYELRDRGHSVAREFNVRVMFKGRDIGHQRLDMVVDNTVVVELKSTPVLAPVARRQLHGYLKATSLEVGLLLHFGPEAKFYRSFAANPSRRASG